MKILWRQESACTNSRKTSPASLYYPTNTSTLNSQTSKLTFGNNVSLKTLTILTQRNVDGKWRRIALYQSGSTAPSFHQVCHVGNLADKSTVRRQTAQADDEIEELPPAEPPKKKQRSETTKSSPQSHSTVFHTSVVELSPTSESSSSSDLVLSDSETVTDSDYSDR